MPAVGHLGRLAGRYNGRFGSTGRQLIKLEYQDFLALREGAKVLERDPTGDKVLRLADGTFIKMFRRKRLISSAAWYPYAQRFADNAAALAGLGIPSPRVIAVYRIADIGRDAVHYHPLEGTTLRELWRNGLPPERERKLKKAFNGFVAHLHDLGVYFRSLHLGNVIVTPEGELGLIDISDLRVHRRPLGRFLRARNLRRMENTVGDCDWLDHQLLLESARGAHKKR